MRTVLITGAARGIGAATAERFKKEGYEVITPARSDMDLASKESVLAYIEANKNLEIDTLVNNAGINPVDLIEDIKDSDIEEAINVNLVSPMLLIRGFVKGMKKRKYGRIVNIGSIWGIISKEKRTVYSAAKNGIHGITNTLAVELGGSNILVNTVCPGFTDTELTRKNLSEEERKKIAAEIPLGRFAEPSEIASVIFNLGSEQNTYITGQKIVVDGGFTVR